MGASFLVQRQFSLLDRRTLLDLGLKGVLLRYAIRILSLLILIALPTCYGYIRVAPVCGLVLCISVLTGICSIFMLAFVQREPFEESERSEQFLKEVNDIFARVGKLPDIEQKSEINKAMNLLNFLIGHYRKFNKIEKLIMTMRYEASFLLYARKYTKALSKIESTRSFVASLPWEIVIDKEVRAEIARLWVTMATIYLATGYDEKEASELLERASHEFRELKLVKEIEAVSAMIERIKTRKKVR